MMKKFQVFKRIKGDECDNNELPLSTQSALESYPRIAASPDFNRRVLEKIAIASTPSRLELWCDRMDEIFARPILKLLGAACLGTFFALIGSGALIVASGGSTPEATPAEIRTANQDANHESGAMIYGLDSQSRMAMMRELQIPFTTQMPPRREYSRPRAPSFPAPAKREKTIKDAPDKRSSSCPAAFRSPV